MEIYKRESKEIITLIAKTENLISFNIAGNKEPILLLNANGDIFVKGKLVENDIEVVNGLREFLKIANYE